MKAMGVKTLAAEIGILGMGGAIELHTDSSAAKSFASRRGFGRCRHIDTKCLWLQQAILNSEVVVRKISGTRNPADVSHQVLAMRLRHEDVAGHGCCIGVAAQRKESSGRGRM